MTGMLLLSLTSCSLLSFPLMLQPLSLGLSIMVCTMLMCVSSAMLLSSWYAYVLFLIYVGGLLVMFAYVAALSPNLLFKGAFSLIFLTGMVLPMFVVFCFLVLSDLSSLSLLDQYISKKVLSLQGMGLVSPGLISIYMSLGVILLLNLIVVVKVCYYQQAPLRPFS